MKEIFYKVTLLSDVVLNSSLATEGNMTTLDYIPGSNFLGIVAGKLYDKKLKEELSEETFSIFHSGKVRFGDATISKDNCISYALPSMFFMDKLSKEIGTDPVYLDYLIDRSNPPSDLNGNRLQLKQQRDGYLLTNGLVIKEIEKSFAIKSAQDRDTRTSKSGAMFGFESLNKGLEFIFSIQFDEESFIDEINQVIEGNHRLGKSKNAEFGQIHIEKMPTQPKNIDSFENIDSVLVYVQSNLCFLDENGMPTFKPTAEQLGLNKEAEVGWDKSQIRTYSYSPWNFKRNTSNTQRDCILKGSVFYVTGAKITSNTKTVGIHQAEGFGKVIYNPLFLEGDEKAKCKFSLSKYLNSNNKIESTQKVPSTVLSKYLLRKLDSNRLEKEISEAVQKNVYPYSDDITRLKKITSSQWGGIRAYATKTKDFDELLKQLFDKEIGYLTHGVAYEKHWGKNRDLNLNAFQEICNKNRHHGTQFVAKFAAEMAKESRKLKNN